MTENQEQQVTPETPVETPAPEVVEAPAPQEAVPAKPADPKDRQATLREAMIAKGVIKPKVEVKTSQVQGERPRGADGKFVPSQPQVTNTPAANASQVATVLPLPRSLKKELEPHWKTANAELQRAYLQRDADYEKGIAQYRTRAEQADAILNEVKPYENIFRQTGTDARQTIKNLMPVAAVLASGTPQQKATVILQAMSQYGVQLDHLAQMAQAPQMQTAMDPNYQALATRIQELTQFVQGSHQKTQQEENQRISLMAESFGRDKPNFEQMRPQMWSLLQAQATAEAQGLNGPLGSPSETAIWGESQWIENAYNAALRLDPTHFQAELTRHRDEALKAERAQATQAAQASRNAAVQVRGAPGGPATPAQIDPKDRQAVIRNALRSRLN